MTEKRGKASFVTMDLSDVTCKNIESYDVVQKYFSPDGKLAYKTLDDALIERGKEVGIVEKAVGPAVKDLALTLSTRAKNKAGAIPLETRKVVLDAAKRQDKLSLPVKGESAYAAKHREQMAGQEGIAIRQTLRNVPPKKKREVKPVHPLWGEVFDILNRYKD